MKTIYTSFKRMNESQDGLQIQAILLTQNCFLGASLSTKTMLFQQTPRSVSKGCF